MPDQEWRPAIVALCGGDDIGAMTAWLRQQTQSWFDSLPKHVKFPLMRAVRRVDPYMMLEQVTARDITTLALAILAAHAATGEV